VSVRNDIRRIAGSLGVLGTELEQKGVTALDVLAGWEAGPTRPPTSFDFHDEDEADPAAEDRRQERNSASRAGVHRTEFESDLRALDRLVQSINRRMDMACPPDMSELRNRRTGEFDPETAADALAAGWCPNCWQVDQAHVPLTKNRSGIRYYSDRCRPCGDFRKEHGIDKPRPIVAAHLEGRRLSPQEVDSAVAAARAALAPAKKRKGKKKRRAA
jgi:hypothetical protein